MDGLDKIGGANQTNNPPPQQFEFGFGFGDFWDPDRHSMFGLWSDHLSFFDSLHVDLSIELIHRFYTRNSGLHTLLL